MGGRKNIKGTSRKPKAHKRESYGYRFKNAVLKHFRESNNMESTSKRFWPEVNERAKESVRKNVYRWRAADDMISLKASRDATASQRRHRSKGVGTVLSTEAEEGIVQWINLLRRDGVPVSNKMLQLHAIDVAKAYGLQEDEFTGTASWRALFLKRHKFHCEPELAKDRGHQKTLRRSLMLSRELCGRRRFTTSASPRFSTPTRQPSTLSICRRGGSRTVWVKCGGREKDRLSVMILADPWGKSTP